MKLTKSKVDSQGNAQRKWQANVLLFSFVCDEWQRWNTNTPHTHRHTHADDIMCMWMRALEKGVRVSEWAHNDTLSRQWHAIASTERAHLYVISHFHLLFLVQAHFIVGVLSFQHIFYIAMCVRAQCSCCAHQRQHITSPQPNVCAWVLSIVSLILFPCSTWLKRIKEERDAVRMMRMREKLNTTTSK